MAGLVLVVLSLGFMLFRVVSARPAARSGTLLRTVSLTFRERVLLQRTNLYALGAILLVGALGHWLSYPFELLAILAAYGVLLVPVRYHLTSQGVALNRVVFRRWDEFVSVAAQPRQIVLSGRPGCGKFAIRVLAARQGTVLPLVRSYVTNGGPPTTSDTGKGGHRAKRNRRRRLLARQS